MCICAASLSEPRRRTSEGLTRTESYSYGVGILGPWGDFPLISESTNLSLEIRSVEIGRTMNHLSGCVLVCIRVISIGILSIQYKLIIITRQYYY